MNVSGSILVNINISDTEKVHLIHHLNQIFIFKNEYLNYVDSFKYSNLKANVWVGFFHVRVQIVRKLRQEDCLDSGIGAQPGKLRHFLSFYVNRVGRWMNASVLGLQA